MTTLADLRRRALRSLIPPPRLKLSTWIDQNIRLPEGRVGAVRRGGPGTASDRSRKSARANIRRNNMPIDARHSFGDFAYPPAVKLVLATILKQGSVG